MSPRNETNDARRQTPANKPSKARHAPPAWAAAMIPPGAILVWSHRNGKRSQGANRFGKYITICAGNDPEETRYVLLHEIVHWTTRNMRHDRVFYKDMAEACRKWGFTQAFAEAREEMTGWWA